jgi:hypothetical protein
MKVSFSFPAKVIKVSFTNMNQGDGQLGIKDINSLQTLNKAAFQWINSA